MKENKWLQDCTFQKLLTYSAGASSQSATLIIQFRPTMHLFAVPVGASCTMVARSVVWIRECLETTSIYLLLEKNKLVVVLRLLLISILFFNDAELEKNTAVP